MLRKLKEDILGSIKNKKINIFFLFLLLSFVILIFSKLSKSYTNTIAFGINKVNIPDKYVILNDSRSELNITLKTSGFKWALFYINKPKLDVDFTKDVSNLGNTFVLEKSNILFNAQKQLGSGVDLMRVSPGKLIFNYDVNLVKKVPVKLISKVKFASGFDTESGFKMKPDSIVVVGPNAIASKIKSIDTESLVLEEVNSDVSVDIKLQLPKSKDLKFSSEKTHVTTTVKKFTEGTLKIPVSIVNVPDDIVLNYFPKFVNVTYSTSLDNFANVKADDFIVECDFKSKENEQSFFIPDITKAPNYVKNLKISQQHVEFIILE